LHNRYILLLLYALVLMKVNISSNHLCCEDVLKAVFDLNTLDYHVFQCLRKQGPLRASEIAQRLQKERSTIYRSLQKLCSCNLCTKSTNNLPAGGYYHIYDCTDNHDVKQELQHCIDTWYQQVKHTLKRFDSEFN